MSSSLPAQIQEFRNLIQGILRGLRGKEFTPTHPGFSLTPHFFVIWAYGLEKRLHVFCPETLPTLTPCSSVPLAERPPAAQRVPWLGPRSIPVQPHVWGQKICYWQEFPPGCINTRDTGILCKGPFCSEISKNFQEFSSISFLYTTLFTEIKSPEP